MKKIILYLVISLGSVFIYSSSASAAGFEAGRIIDDDVFTNNSSMSASDIQTFLNSKVSWCDTWGTQTSEFGGGTRRQWAEARGYYPPYTCLKDFSENGKSAAQIIYDVSQSFTINPQVLIVLLQKEQGLVTDTWPISIQYKTATGYGCPDTAPCDSQYFGLTNQLTWSARMFRAILNNSPTWYTPYILGNNYIQYSPDSNCGGSTVNIQNRSTQALYNYTPYQPNQAALDAGWGQANCGAYGNRNFHLYFTNWFGPTTGPAYRSTFHSQSSYLTLRAGETKKIWFKFKNTGFKPWGDDISAYSYNPVHLATSQPANRTSIFSTSWPSSNRPNFTFSRVFEDDGTTPASNQHVVNPGQIAMFEVSISAPATAKDGFYKEGFTPIREGASDWWLGSEVWTGITVEPTYKAIFHNQSSYPTLRENDKADIFLSYVNGGNTPWYDDISVPPGTRPIHLATTDPINRPNEFGHAWVNKSRPSVQFSSVYEADGMTLSSDQHVVNPGQIGKFSFTITGMMNSASSGYYKASFQPIVEGDSNWNMGGNAWLGITYASSKNNAQYYTQSNWPTVNRGQSANIYFSFKNTGEGSWRDDLSNIKGIMPLHLATAGPINRTSQFKNSSWINGNRPSVTLSSVYEADGMTLSSDQHVVNPGQIGKFSFTITAPTSLSPGVYTEQFQPILEGAPGTRWNLESTVFSRITVQ